MQNFIPIQNYEKVNSITFGEFTDNSSEGHNYYMGFNDPKDIILERINKDGVYIYDRVYGPSQINNETCIIIDFIGSHGNSSVFDMKDIDEFGFVMIDTEIKK